MKKTFLFGLLSSIAAGLVSAVFRLILGVPTPPEVLSDFVVRLIPLKLFLLALVDLGSWAKVVLTAALALALIAAGGLFGMAYHALLKSLNTTRLGQKLWAAISLALLLWVLESGIFLVISGRGFFGTLVHPWPSTLIATWLFTCCLYSAVFIGLSSNADVPRLQPVVGGISRRSFLKTLAYIGAGLILASSIGATLLRLVEATKQKMSATGTLTPEITPNQDFYTVSKGIIDPALDSASWRLEITGLVDRPQTFTFVQLVTFSSVTTYLTLECISNETGGREIGNAQWKGVRLRDLLIAASVKDTAKTAVLYGTDDYSDSITLAQAMADDVILAYEMNALPLPGPHGFPARLLIPGIYGMKNVKWLTRIELTDQDYVGFWESDGWSNQAVIQTMSRIDVPGGDFHSGPNEPIPLGGIAFAGDRGISKVEITADDGKTWNQASLAPPLSPFTWVLWVYNWTPTETGSHIVWVRATDGRGNLQTGVKRDALPDGATGYDNSFIVIE